MICIGKRKCTSEKGLLKPYSAILGPEIVPTPRASDVSREKLQKSSSIDSNLRAKYCDFSLTLTLTLTLLNLLGVQNSISNWRRKQDDVPIDIELILPGHISPS